MNEMVSVEIAAVTEYQQHAYISDDPHLIDLLEDFSIDEMEHIEWCSREVVRLGGLPTVKPMEIKECAHESKAFLERDIEIESLAISRLKEFIKIAEEEGDNRIKKLLEEILADEETHHDKLKSMLNPPTSFKEKLNENMDIGAGLILTGLFWLSLWLFPFYSAFVSDSRWAHNFAYPLILITIGIAYKGKKMSSDLFAMISAFMIIPTETGMISGMLSTEISIVLLAAVIILIVVEKSRKQELLFFQHRWRRWLQIRPYHIHKPPLSYGMSVSALQNDVVSRHGRRSPQFSEGLRPMQRHRPPPEAIDRIRPDQRYPILSLGIFSQATRDERL